MRGSPWKSWFLLVFDRCRAAGSECVELIKTRRRRGEAEQTAPGTGLGMRGKVKHPLLSGVTVGAGEVMSTPREDMRTCPFPGSDIHCVADFPVEL